MESKIATLYPIDENVEYDSAGHNPSSLAPVPKLVYYVKDFPVTMDLKCIIGLHLITGEENDYCILTHATDLHGNRIDPHEITSKNKEHIAFNIQVNGKYMSYFLETLLHRVTIPCSGVYTIISSLYPSSPDPLAEPEKLIDSISTNLLIVKDRGC